MRGKTILLGAAGLVVADAAEASDKLTIAPPPAWVTQVAVPIDDGKAGEAAVKVLLTDEQVDLQPRRVARFAESVIKVQTPQGLQAGAVNFAWNPDTMSVTVNRLLIRRGTQVIDVLKSGQSFTVLRRETNLENAVLDGQLTASIQPEGLQVGDIIDFAMTAVISDPALGDHVEEVGAGWNGVPIARAHLRVRWPATLPMRIQASGGLAQPQVVREGDRSVIDVSADDLQPVALPKGAPPRYNVGRLIEMTDLPSWSGLAGLMAPLYTKAEQLPPASPLRGEIARIRAGSGDPKQQAQAALALVQDRIRYVFLGMNDGGLVPATADETWSRRFGDCKGKTVLLLALLHALGIEAQPVIVSAAVGDGLDARLPALSLFNHVLVRARIGGRSYWLDGTRVGDTSLDGIETPYMRWGLPLTPGSSALVAMVPPPLARPQTDVAIHIDATAGLTVPAPVHIVRLTRGDEAVGMNLGLKNLAGDARHRALREFLKGRYDFVDPTRVAATFDPVARELTMTMDGTTKMDWNDGWYEADHVSVGYRADFSREPGPNHDAPFAVDYPSYVHVIETILLPPKTGTFTLAKDAQVDQTVAGMEYKRHAQIDGDRFVVDESERSLSPEFPFSEAAAAEDRLRALNKHDVFINRPANYVGTAADRAAIATSSPTDAPGLAAKADALASQGKAKEALAAMDQLVALDPRNVGALSARAMARLNVNDLAGVRTDLDAASAIEPNNPGMLGVRGMLADKEGKLDDASRFYTAALASRPGEPFLLTKRAQLYVRMGKADLALADADAVLKQRPNVLELYLLRANIFHSRGDKTSAGNQAAALVKVAPNETWALVAAAKIYAAIGDNAAAFRTFDQALAVKPEAFIYLNRYAVRKKADRGGRAADLDAALKLEPHMREALLDRASMREEVKDWSGAGAALALVTDTPADSYLRVHRGVLHAKAGDLAAAKTDFDAAYAAAGKNAWQLNNLCWEKATAGVALERALAECDAAIAIAPDAPNIRDSRAFVLLRLGRSDEAIAEYNRVLAKAPQMASSLYGRAVAERKRGDTAAARRDLAAAIKLAPDTRERFDGYGVGFDGATHPDEREAAA